MTRWIGVMALTFVFGLPTAGFAQTPSRRWWADVNLGVAAAAEKQFDQSGVEIKFGEPATSRADYNLPSGASFDFGMGFMVTRTIGVGVSFTGTAHQDEAQLEIEVPHPNFFNAYAFDSALTQERLVRAEGGVHTQVMVVAYDRNRVRVRLFGGPSHLRAEQDAVDSIRYNQVFGVFNSSNSVTILDDDSRIVDGSGWGFHAGGDVTYFVSRIFGLGGFARITRAAARRSATGSDRGTRTSRRRVSGGRRGAGEVLNPGQG